MCCAVIKMYKKRIRIYIKKNILVTPKMIESKQKILDTNCLKGLRHGAGKLVLVHGHAHVVHATAVLLSALRILCHRG